MMMMIMMMAAKLAGLHWGDHSQGLILMKRVRVQVQQSNDLLKDAIEQIVRSISGKIVNGERQLSDDIPIMAIK
jgi:hypothetical protein